MTRLVLALLTTVLAGPALAQPALLNDSWISLRAGGGTSYTGSARVQAFSYGVGLTLGPLDLTVARVRIGDDRGLSSQIRSVHSTAVAGELTIPVTEMATVGAFFAHQWSPFERQNRSSSGHPIEGYTAWRTLYGNSVGMSIGNRIFSDESGQAALVVRPFFTMRRWGAAPVPGSSDDSLSNQVGVTLDFPTQIYLPGAVDLLFEPSIGYGEGAGLIFGASASLLLN